MGSPQAHEGAHDLDVDHHGTLALEDAGEHPDALLSKCVGQVFSMLSTSIL
jgi:hypothetical protein